MAGEFKGLPVENQDAQLAERAGLIARSQGLFENFDPETHGGLRVAPDDQIYEIRHPKWAEDNATVADRSMPTPMFLRPDGSIEHRVPDFDPTQATRGSEFEIAVMHESTGGWWKVSPDGKKLVYPDGSSEPLKTDEHNFDPEALQVQIEFQTGIARSTAEHRRNVVETVLNTERWMEEHGLQTPYLSDHPEDFGSEDVNQLSYVIRTTDNMANMREFGVMSAQLTIQDLDHEAAQHAVNESQEDQAVISLLTSAAPIRDGRFDTTIAEHYTQRPKDEGGPYDQPAIPKGDFAWLSPGVVLYDHREPSRVIGSQSAGTFRSPGKLELVEHLREADQKLRDGTNIIMARTLGWHTDRRRIEKGATEYCSIGTAGGNLYKLLATQELTAASHLGKQLCYAQATPVERKASADRYEDATNIGHINNIMITLHGKQALLGTSENARTPQEALDDMIAEADHFAPEPLSEETKAELRATLSLDMPAYETVDETFAAFFQPRSPMTATDALRYAHQLEPDTPVNDLLLRFAHYRRQHVHEVATAMGIERPVNILGKLVLAR